MQRDATELEQLRREAQRVRDARALGRSLKIQTLFDHLVTAAVEGRQLREFDVACEVFDKDAQFDPVADAIVRVHVHRLRRKLEEFYDGTPDDRPRLGVPRGEYRLELKIPGPLEDPADVPDVPVAEGATKPAGPRSSRPTALSWIGWLIALALLVALLVQIRMGRDPEATRLADLEETALWQHFTTTDDVKMLLLESWIPDQGAGETGVGNGQGSLPIGIAPALRDLLPLIHHQENMRQYAMAVPTTRIRAEMIKRHSFVYVGFLSGLYENLPSSSEGSAFEFDQQAGTIVDKVSRRRMLPSLPDREERDTHIEYAYLATFDGPGGNRIVAVTGTANASLQEAARLASDLVAMERLSREVGDARDFEALYEVRATGDLGLSARLVRAAARPSPSWSAD